MESGLQPTPCSADGLFCDPCAGRLYARHSFRFYIYKIFDLLNKDNGPLKRAD